MSPLDFHSCCLNIFPVPQTRIVGSHHGLLFLSYFLINSSVESVDSPLEYIQNLSSTHQLPTPHQPPFFLTWILQPPPNWPFGLCSHTMSTLKLSYYFWNTALPRDTPAAHFTEGHPYHALLWPHLIHSLTMHLASGIPALPTGMQAVRTEQLSVHCFVRMPETVSGIVECPLNVVSNKRMCCIAV
jgi:hypothetical protein